MSVAFDPQAKVIGQVLFILPENTKAESIQHLTQKYNLETLDPDAWYPVSTVLELFKDITTGSEAMFNLVSIGMAVAEHAVLPPEFDTLSAAQLFENIDQVYQAQHQGDVGRLITHKIAEGHYQIETISPYPDDFWYGNYYGWALRYVPKDTRFVVKYTESHQQRDQGGEKTLIEVKW